MDGHGRDTNSLKTPQCGKRVLRNPGTDVLNVAVVEMFISLSTAPPVHQLIWLCCRLRTKGSTHFTQHTIKSWDPLLQDVLYAKIYIGLKND